jgi:hypothetical protein
MGKGSAFDEKSISPAPGEMAHVSVHRVVPEQPVHQRKEALIDRRIVLRDPFAVDIKGLFRAFFIVGKNDHVCPAETGIISTEFFIVFLSEHTRVFAM